MSLAFSMHELLSDRGPVQATVEHFADAFPASISADLATVVRTMPDGNVAPSSKRWSYVLDGQVLRVPVRQYFPEPAAEIVRRYTPSQLAVASALYCSHHDGFVRQRAFRILVTTRAPWVPALTLRLLGEYVVPIHSDVLHHAKSGDLAQAMFATFASENEALLETTIQRIISYLDAYGWAWTRADRDLSVVSARDALVELGLWRPSVARGLMKRAERWPSL
ncbi:MAG: hypothetical protein JWM90_3060 [Thermoleophilia bacterium]|nr:hypothetical protein [Thermoleophilia bacterium]